MNRPKTFFCSHFKCKKKKYRVEPSLESKIILSVCLLLIQLFTNKTWYHKFILDLYKLLHKWVRLIILRHNTHVNNLSYKLIRTIKNYWKEGSNYFIVLEKNLRYIHEIKKQWRDYYSPMAFLLGPFSSEL